MDIELQPVAPQIPPGDDMWAHPPNPRPSRLHHRKGYWLRNVVYACLWLVVILLWSKPDRGALYTLLCLVFCFIIIYVCTADAIGICSVRHQVYVV